MSRKLTIAMACDSGDRTTTTEKWHHETYRRLHRKIAVYLAHFAWCKGVDCVCLDRSHLVSLFGMNTFKNSRLDWFKEDVSEWFPHVDLLYYADAQKLGAIFLSRVPFPEGSFSGVMQDEQRIVRLGEFGIKAAILPAAEYSEDIISVDLLMLASGLDASVRRLEE